MGASSTLVSVEEYLSTSYPDGDREYIDGQVVERNMGEVDHSDLQTTLAVYFRNHCKSFWAGAGVRTQVKRTRFRVPDVCLVRGGNEDV